MDFSIILIAKNEEKTLPVLFASIQDFLEAKGDIVLCDTGSTDKTIEVAKSYGIKVVEAGEVCYKTIDQKAADALNAETLKLDGKKVVEVGDRVFDFAAARNFADQFAKNDWVFQPDCDEVVKWNLAELKTQLPENKDSVSCWITAGKDKWRTVRFYNRKKTKWTGITHNSVGFRWTDLDENVLILDHQQERKEDRPKRIKALALGAYLQPEDGRRLFYYGRDLLWRGFPNTAVKVLDKAGEIHSWASEKAQCYIYKGDAQMKVGDEKEAIKSFEACAKIAPLRRVGHMRLLKFYASKHDWPNVVKHCQAALAIPNVSTYIENVDDYGETADDWLYVAQDRLAKSAYLSALRKFPLSEKIKSDWHYFLPFPKVSICIPTLGRPEKLKRLLELIKKNAQWPNYEVIVEHDSFEDRQGVPKILKKAVARSTGELVMFLGNDCQPEPGFLFHAMRQMYLDLPNLDGLVALNDGVWGTELATHWLASKKLLPRLGGEFFSTAYEHTYCDRELTERCKEMKKFTFAVEAKLIHDNPIVHGGELDEVNKIAADMDRRRRDFATYEKRQKDLAFTG